MQRTIDLIICIVLVFSTSVFLWYLQKYHKNPDTKELVVSAAASLKDVMTEIQATYKKSNTKIALTLNFGSAGTISHQIQQGALVDVVIFPSVRHLDGLEKSGLLLENTRKNLLRNRLVLIAPADSKIQDFVSLADKEVRLISIGEVQSVPAGQYAKEVLDNLKIWEKLEPKFVYAKDVRQVLSYVETENIDAGIVYLTDAKSSNKVKLVAMISEELHSPIVYPIAIIKNSKQAQEAKNFLDFLASPEASQIFEKYGFTKG